MLLAEHLGITVTEACHRYGTAITEQNAIDACAQKSVGGFSVAGLAAALGTGTSSPALVPRSSSPALAPGFLNISTVGASGIDISIAALNSDAVLPGCMLAANLPEPEHGYISPPTPVPEPEHGYQSPPPTPVPELTFCQSAESQARPKSIIPDTRATAPEPVPEISCQSATPQFQLSTRGRKRKVVDYSTAAQESKKLCDARLKTAWWN